MVCGSMKTSIFVYSWVMKSQRAHQGGEAAFLLTETLGSLLLLSSSHLWLCQVDMDPKKKKRGSMHHFICMYRSTNKTGQLSTGFRETKA